MGDPADNWLRLQTFQCHKKHKVTKDSRIVLDWGRLKRNNNQIQCVNFNWTLNEKQSLKDILGITEET